MSAINMGQCVVGRSPSTIGPRGVLSGKTNPTHTKVVLNSDLTSAHSPFIHALRHREYRRRKKFGWRLPSNYTLRYQSREHQRDAEFGLKSVKLRVASRSDSNMYTYQTVETDHLEPFLARVSVLRASVAQKAQQAHHHPTSGCHQRCKMWTRCFGAHSNAS